MRLPMACFHAVPLTPARDAEDAVHEYQQNGDDENDLGGEILLHGRRWAQQKTTAAGLFRFLFIRRNRSNGTLHNLNLQIVRGQPQRNGLIAE